MLLRHLFEAPGRTAVIAFGRMNPPTIGHQKLIDKLTSIPGDHYLFLSHTQNPKKNPLDFHTKVKFAEKFFPGVKTGSESVRTPIDAMKKIEELGYNKVVFVAGSDRESDFSVLFDKYNGVEYKFDSIQVVSAGERDPDADGAEGMSASKMRVAAASGNLEAFAQGVPDKRLAEELYNAVRAGMGVKDQEPVSAESIEKHKGAKHKYQMTHPDGTTMKFAANDDADAEKQGAAHHAKSVSKQQRK
jgi:nicotinic acid mononucleotide adenylyltransferase